MDPTMDNEPYKTPDAVLMVEKTAVEARMEAANEPTKTPPTVYQSLSTDWKGNRIDDDEPDETQIGWWQVDPHPWRPGFVLVERSWQLMCERIGDGIEMLLDDAGEDALLEGVAVTFKLVKGTLGQYRDICDSDH